MNENLTQWHPAFCSAIKLELLENKADLIYQSEVGLNTKPILIDLLVIRKSPDISITKEIGRIFKGHNLFEYKSPDDALNIDTLYKGIAYACLYKARGEKVGSIYEKDITISFVRKRYPSSLMKTLKEQGIRIEQRTKGIYYIEDGLLFPIQIIVSKELDEQEYIWLTALSDELSLQDAERLVMETTKLVDKDDKEYSESVLQVVMAKNREVFQKIKEVPEMCEEMAKLMKPEIDAAVEAAVGAAVEAAVSAAVDEAVNAERERARISLVCKKINRGYSLEEIADVLEEEPARIKSIYDIALEQKPNYDIDKIMKHCRK